MGTRSLTHVHDKDGETILTFYKQHDGYPEGWGKELSEFLSDFLIVNGLSGEKGKIANGMGCLAAQIMAHFKDAPGQFYVYKPNAKDCGEEYVYNVKLGAHGEFTPNGGKWPRVCWTLVLTLSDPDGKESWSGAPEKFVEFLKGNATKQEA